MFLIKIWWKRAQNKSSQKNPCREKILPEKKLDYKSIGLNSSKYEITSIDKNEELNSEIINVKTFYDKWC